MKKILTISAIALCLTTDLSAMRNYTPQYAAGSYSQPSTRAITWRMPNMEERRYSDGSVYVGEFKDSKKHGQGKMTYKNGDTYEGLWKNDLPNGYGIYTFSDGGGLYWRI